MFQTHVGYSIYPDYLLINASCTTFHRVFLSYVRSSIDTHSLSILELYNVYTKWFAVMKYM